MAPMCFQSTYFTGADADATHCHLPPVVLTHVSVQRSLAFTGFPVPSVPLPVQEPVTTAESPCTVTLTSAISLVVHLAFFVRAITSALERKEPSESIDTKSSANIGARASASPAFEAFAHWCSMSVNACAMELV